MKGIYTIGPKQRMFPEREMPRISLKSWSPLQKSLLLACLAALFVMAFIGAHALYISAPDIAQGETTQLEVVRQAVQDTLMFPFIASCSVFVASYIFFSVASPMVSWFAIGAGAMTGIGVHGALHNFNFSDPNQPVPRGAVALAALPEQTNDNQSTPTATLPEDTASMKRDEEESRRMLAAASLYDGPYNDSVLLLGMNKEASSKAYSQLRRHDNMSLIVDGNRQDEINLGGKTHKLTSKVGIQKFVATLGLPKAKADQVVEALDACDAQARDEMGRLAVYWARAEKKQEKLPSRLMLGGHSNGDGVWGDNNGSLRLGPLLKLSAALPYAANQIEDVLVTGCYSGGELTMEQYRYIFPQAKTIWAYENQAPGVDNGGMLHQTGWIKATRGRETRLSRDIAQWDKKKIAIWTKSQGYIADTPPLDTNALRGKVQWLQKHAFYPAFNGLPTTDIDGFDVPIEITNPHTGLVRQYYGWLVRLTQDKGLPDHEREVWVAKKHQTIRLLYYNATVAPRFMRQYANQVHQGYAAVNMKTPDYTRMPRAQALHHIKQFAYKVKGTKNPPAQAVKTLELLKQGLWHLDREVIPDGWV